MRRFFPIVILALLACGTDGDTPDRRTLIDSRDTYDPRSLDPALSTDVPTGRAVAYVFDGLTRFTPDAQVEPALARSWDLSEDGTTYTFHLRSGVRFHDGTPFSSRNVVLSWERVLDPATRGGRPWPLHPIRGAREFADGSAQTITGLSAPDDSTLVITLTEPFAIFPKLLAMPVASIVPETVPADFGERPVGTGPWRFVEWRHDDHLLFARNDEYFDTPPAADSLLARIIPEVSTSVAEFERGNVDVLAVPEGETRRWRETPELNELLRSAPSLRLWYVSINTTRGPLSDPRVRQALNMAVDREAILNQLAGGHGRLAAGVIPHELGGADDSREPYPYDTLRARELLTEAGHPNGIDVELWHSQEPVFSRVAQTLQGYLSQAGIRVKLVQRDGPSVREASRNGQVDLHLKDWWADYPDGENFLFPLLHGRNTGVGGNVSFFTNARFDDIVSRARAEPDEGARLDLYREADALAFEQAPMIFLFFSHQLLAVQPWIEGFEAPAIFNGQRWTGVRIDK